MEGPQTRHLGEREHPRRAWENSTRADGASVQNTSTSAIRQSQAHPHSAHHYNQPLPGPNSLLENRPQDDQSMPRSESRLPPLQLPPIRELVDLSERGERRDREDASPTSAGKRRWTSDEEDEADESRDSMFPRRHKSPRTMERPHTAATTAGPVGRAGTAYTSDTRSARSSPFQSGQTLPSMRSSPPTYEMPGRPDERPTLPSLPSLLTHNASVPRSVQPFTDYPLSSPRHSTPTYAHFPPYEPSPSCPPQPSTYAYGHPARGHSYPGPSRYLAGNDRSPFSASHHAVYAPGYAPDGNDRDSDNRQRKRRGNLPKETTDKLRAWFVSHLNHPYPTEDEKLELMRQTGLQMNQISNWFINARRRQLPAMINNARAESNARAGRLPDGSLPSQNTVYAEMRDVRSSSDGDGSVYDD